MKILLTVELYWPSRGGCQEVVRQFARRLAERGHDVTVATSADPARSEGLIDGVRVVGFEISGNEVSGYRGDTQAYVNWVRDKKADVILNYSAQVWPTDLLLPMLPELEARKVLVPCGYSMLRVPRYRDYYARLPAILRGYDRIVHLSDIYRDAEFAREHALSHTVVIPNGCGADEFDPVPSIDIRRRLGIAPEAFLVLHVGSHTALKGHGDCLRIFRGARLREAHLLLVGNDVLGGCGGRCRARAWLANWSPADRLRRSRVTVADLDREAIVAAHHAADLFLFPSNVECSPLVLFEAAATRTPFLATDVGNVAEIARWTGGGEILPTTYDSVGLAHVDVAAGATRLRALWRDQPGRERMGQAAHAAWRDRFTWEKIVSDYERLFFDLVEEGR
jgi:glycosyltransferase involved in cell wall biosynthesis